MLTTFGTFAAALVLLAGCASGDDGGAFDSGNLASGKSFSFTFDQAGTFAYHCMIHQRMTGKVTVTG